MAEGVGGRGAMGRAHSEAVAPDVVARSERVLDVKRVEPETRWWWLSALPLTGCRVQPVCLPPAVGGDRRGGAHRPVQRPVVALRRLCNGRAARAHRTRMHSRGGPPRRREGVNRRPPVAGLRRRPRAATVWERPTAMRAAGREHLRLGESDRPARLHTARHAGRHHAIQLVELREVDPYALSCLVAAHQKFPLATVAHDGDAHVPRVEPTAVEVEQLDEARAEAALYVVVAAPSSSSAAALLQFLMLQEAEDKQQQAVG